MLSWLFKKRGAAAATPAAPPRPAASAPRQDPARPAAVDHTAWQARIAAATGDDAALLQLALTAPLWPLKLAAVQAIAGDDMLKQAERALRHHDSRVHQAARQRLQAGARRRATQAKAEALTLQAAALASEMPMPLNHLAALDRDWATLDATWLEAAQTDRFNELRARLDQLLHEQGEQLRRQQQAAAAQALAEAQRRAAERVAELAAAATPSQPTPSDAAPGDGLPGDAAPHDAAPGDAMPGDAMPGDDAIASAAAPATPRRSAPRRPDAEQLRAIDDLLQQAEAAAEAGRSGELQHRLQAVDAALQALDGAPLDAARRQRSQALHAEASRLAGWQRWGGGRARDDLLAEAEALARLSLLATAPPPEIQEPTAPPPPAAAAATGESDAAAAPGASAVATDAADAADAVDSAAAAAAPVVKAAGRSNAPKLQLKAHGEAIQSLRQRWKALDRLGAAASPQQWRRFDAALQTAYQPVAAHLAALQAERLANLAARESLLDALDAAPEAAPLKEQLRALDSFQTAWRRLGPIEHTVPAASRTPLQQRLQRSVERLDAPLQQARQQAERAREALIVAAQALLPAPGKPPPHDSTARVRELQGEWQQQARSLPLARPVEAALWARFKAATDAVFAQREAAFQARNAEQAAEQAAREAHAAQQRQLAERRQQEWLALCDDLAERLALCDERESGSADADDLAARWAALKPPSAAPAAWAQALAARWSSAGATAPLTEAAFDELLLDLEVGLDLPATPEQQAARRALKLRALKQALEGRGAAQPLPAAPADPLAAALRQSGATALQRERLRRLVEALRQAPAGTLAAPRTRG